MEGEIEGLPRLATPLLAFCTLFLLSAGYYRPGRGTYAMPELLHKLCLYYGCRMSVSVYIVHNHNTSWRSTVISTPPSSSSSSSEWRKHFNPWNKDTSTKGANYIIWTLSSITLVSRLEYNSSTVLIMQRTISLYFSLQATGRGKLPLNAVAFLSIQLTALQYPRVNIITYKRKYYS